MQEHDAMDGDTDGGDTKGNLDYDNIGSRALMKIWAMRRKRYIY